jgi:hypothetical protein
MKYWDKYYVKMLFLPVFFSFMAIVFVAKNFIKRKLPEDQRIFRSSTLDQRAHGSTELDHSRPSITVERTSRPSVTFDQRTDRSGTVDLLAKAQQELQDRKQSSWNRFKAGAKLFIPMVATTAVTLYTFLISNSVNPFNCVSSTTNGKQMYFMVNNPSQECYKGEWVTHLPAAVFFSLVYGIAFPGAVAFVFYKNRKHLDDREFSFGYGSLVFLYKRVFFYWELVSMFQRAGFIITTQFLTSRANVYTAKFVSSIAIMGFFSGLEALYQPYATYNTNLLSTT